MPTYGLSRQARDGRILNAAWAIGPEQFCISLDEEDVDDPFSIVLSYDGRFPQPWSRVDVPRLVRGIMALTEEDGHQTYVAMSDEGDVCFLHEDVTVHEKIPGAGIYSSDAADRGAVFQIFVHEGRLCVVGDRDQVYLRADDENWRWLGSGDGIAGPDYLGLLSRGGVSAGSAGLLCFGMAMHRKVERTPELDDVIQDALQREDHEEYAELLTASVNNTPSDEAQTHVWRENNWSRLPMPRNVPLRCGFAERPDKIWLVGLEGAIFRGNPEDGFEDFCFAGEGDDLYAITRFRQDMIVASGYGLHRFDGHILSPLKPSLDPAVNGGIPNPLSVQSAGEVMFYFDYKHGVCRWDGEIWEWINIPEPLLERSFQGLQE